MPYVAAVVQAASVAFDRARTLGKLRDLVSDAARRGASLVVFPEAFVSGYPRGLDFGAKVGWRTPEGREAFRRYAEGAIEIPGADLDLIASAASDHRVHLVVGVIEREGGTLYCTVVFIGPDGRYLGKHRKLMPTALERLIWGFGDGSTLGVHATAVGRLGAAICWENYMPLLRTAMYAQGVEIYCAPTADGRATWVPSMRHIALEGRCFVLSCNQFNRRRDFPDDYAAFNEGGPDTVVSQGGSCIVSPLGELLAGPNYEGEAILTAQIDLADIGRAKLDFDAVGHYARPDVFRLDVDTKARPAVRFITDETTAPSGSTAPGPDASVPARSAPQR